MSEYIYLALQATSEDIAKARREFSSDKCGWKRDMLLCAMSYGIQMCLRAQSMHFSASVDTHPQGGNSTEIEVPSPMSGAVGVSRDAQPPSGDS